MVNQLYVCGTNAHNPKDQVVYANLTSLGRHKYVPGVGNGIAKCPCDPEDNSTAVWVENGNQKYSYSTSIFNKVNKVRFNQKIILMKWCWRHPTYGME